MLTLLFIIHFICLWKRILKERNTLAMINRASKGSQSAYSDLSRLSTWNICVTLHFKILLTDICRSKLITAYCGVSKCQVTSLLASKYLFMQGNIFLYISVACSYCIFLLRFAFSLLCLRCSSHGPPKALSFRPVRLYVRACVPSENILRPSCCRLFVVTVFFFIFLACFSFVFWSLVYNEQSFPTLAFI